MSLEKRRFEYKWVILIACFLMNFVCLGFCSSNKALYLTAVTQALNVERSLFALNDTFRYATIAVINLFFGGLLYRLGARKMIAVGFVALIASVLLSAWAQNVVAFYAAGILLGIGLACTTTTITGSIIRRWFKKNVGRYTGIVLAANGVGGALATQIMSPLINAPNDPFGYRRSYLLVAVVLVIVGILVVSVLRERPKNESIEVTDSKKRRGVAWDGISFKTALKRPYFYVAAVTVMLTGFMLQGIGGVYVAHMRDVGLDVGFVATVASISWLILTASKILCGVVYDRFGLRVIMLLCQICAVLALAMLILMRASTSGMVFAVLFAILYALALPLETLAIPLIVNDLFGSAAFEKFLGLFAALNYIGYAASPPLVNLYFDITGSYKPVFLLFGGVTVIACISFQFVIIAAQKEKQRQLQAN